MHNKSKLITFLVAGVLLLVLPLFAQSFGNGPVRIIDLALLYVLLALGLNIVVGYAGLLDLGYVAFYAVGSYLFALMASPHLSENFEAFKAAFPNGLHSPIWFIIPLAAGIAALPAEHRSKLEALMFRVVDSTKRRRRILNLVQEALSQLRLDMKYLVFDLEATRRERDALRQGLDEDHHGRGEE